ncbi:MAG: HAD family hydrolase [Candidatus Omnitrophica bacterium]|nr:HAD family hydrolase [Candidatus Omnitrophota bacterium]
MIRAVIFDFDGVILQSAGIKTEAFRELFHEDFPGHLQKIMDYHRANMGISRHVKFRAIYDGILHLPLSLEEERRLGQRFKDLVYRKMLKAPFTPGAFEFIKRRSGRYAFFIASGAPLEELRAIVKERKIEGYFREIHGSPAVKEDMIHDILSRHGWGPEEAVFIGDAESDQRAAKSARVRFIGCVGEDPSALKHCDRFLRDLTDLDGVLSCLQEET